MSSQSDTYIFVLNKHIVDKQHFLATNILQVNDLAIFEIVKLAGIIVSFSGKFDSFVKNIVLYLPCYIVPVNPCFTFVRTEIKWRCADEYLNNLAENIGPVPYWRWRRSIAIKNVQIPAILHQVKRIVLFVWCQTNASTSDEWVQLCMYMPQSLIVSHQLHLPHEPDNHSGLYVIMIFTYQCWLIGFSITIFHKYLFIETNCNQNVIRYQIKFKTSLIFVYRNELQSKCNKISNKIQDFTYICL